MSYNHLTIEERSCIEYNLKQGVSGSKIAKLLKRDRATISREIRRNKSNGEYLPVEAQGQYKKRRKKCVRKTNEHKPLWDYVTDKLKITWSPE